MISISFAKSTVNLILLGAAGLMGALVSCANQTPTHVPQGASIPSPPAMSTKPSFPEILALYEQGKLTEALAAMRSDPHSFEARVLLAAAQGRSRAVLAEPFDRFAHDPDMLTYRAVAAWRLGEVEPLTQTVVRLAELGKPDHELEAMASVARTARTALRHIVNDVNTSAAFTPSLWLPIIEVRVGNEQARFVFDTGAEVSVVDSEIAARWALPKPAGGSIEVAGTAVKLQTSFSLIPKLNALGVSFEDVPAITADLSPLSSKIGHIDGILAVQDLFSQDVIRIDYQKGIVSRSHDSRDEGILMAFFHGRALVGVEANLNGGHPGFFQIDTGGRRSTVTEHYIQSVFNAGHPIELSGVSSVDVQGVASGKRERRFARSCELCVASMGSCIGLRDVPVDTTPADLGTAQAGKLGADVFRGRTLEFDYPFGRLRMSQSVIP